MNAMNTGKSVDSIETGKAADMDGQWHSYKASLDNFGAIQAFIEEQGKAAGISEAKILKLLLGTEEAAVNIISYAYDTPSDMQVRTYITDKGRFAVQLADHGHPFNPLAKAEKESPASLEEAEPGGLGISLMRKIFADISYKYEEFQGKMSNILTLEFQF